MIHTLPYQSEPLLEANYFKLRNVLNPKADIIHLTVNLSYLQTYTKGDIYKKIVRLDGKYRTEMKKWTAPAIKVRVVEQL